MPGSGVVRDLLDHAAWADAEVWAAVRALPDAFDDKRLREKLHHIHVVQHAFLAIWEGRVIEVAPLDGFATPGAMAAWARSGHESINIRAAAMSPGALEKEASIPWAQLVRERHGEIAAVTLLDTMIQVASHSTYHRGQVNTRLRELGGKPPLVDFIAWGWFGRPAPRWDLERN